jgi:hypothetical protein
MTQAPANATTVTVCDGVVELPIGSADGAVADCLLFVLSVFESISFVFEVQSSRIPNDLWMGPESCR